MSTTADLHKKLQKETTVEGVTNLLNDIARTQSALRSEFESLQPPLMPGVANTARSAAMADGPEGFEKLQVRETKIKADLAFLAELESAAAKRLEQARLDEARRSFEAGRKKYPAALARVKSALTELDAAISECNLAVQGLGNFFELKEKHPLTDEKLAELLAIRNNIWTPRHLATLFPVWMPGEPGAVGDYPKSWPLMYRYVGDDTMPRFRPRRPADFTQN